MFNKSRHFCKLISVRWLLASGMFASLFLCTMPLLAEDITESGHGKKGEQDASCDMAKYNAMIALRKVALHRNMHTEPMQYSECTCELEPGFYSCEVEATIKNADDADAMKNPAKEFMDRTMKQEQQEEDDLQASVQQHKPKKTQNSHGKSSKALDDLFDQEVGSNDDNAAKPSHAVGKHKASNLDDLMEQEQQDETYQRQLAEENRRAEVARQRQIAEEKYRREENDRRVAAQQREREQAQAREAAAQREQDSNKTMGWLGAVVSMKYGAQNTAAQFLDQAITGENKMDAINSSLEQDTSIARQRAADEQHSREVAQHRQQEESRRIADENNRRLADYNRQQQEQSSSRAKLADLAPYIESRAKGCPDGPTNPETGLCFNRGKQPSTGCVNNGTNGCGTR